MNTFNLLYGISYMGMVALTFAAGITYYILRTGYIEMVGKEDDADSIEHVNPEGC